MDKNGYHIESIIWGQLTSYCEQVIAGNKLVAEFGFHKKNTKLIQETIEKEGCKVIFDFERSEERATAYIYKYNFVSLLIKQLWLNKQSRKSSALGIWSSGKLFGYSDYEIALFLQKHGYIKDPFK